MPPCHLPSHSHLPNCLPSSPGPLAFCPWVRRHRLRAPFWGDDHAGTSKRPPLGGGARWGGGGGGQTATGGRGRVCLRHRAPPTSPRLRKRQSRVGEHDPTSDHPRNVTTRTAARGGGEAGRRSGSTSPPGSCTAREGGRGGAGRPHTADTSAHAEGLAGCGAVESRQEHPPGFPCQRGGATYPSR